jgi:hypothetical protein
MMKNFPSKFRGAGSYIAGLLIGLSILIPVFAITAAQPGDGQRLWIFGASIALGLGLLLQLVVTTKSRHRRTTVPDPRGWRPLA